MHNKFTFAQYHEITQNKIRHCLPLHLELFSMVYCREGKGGEINMHVLHIATFYQSFFDFSMHSLNHK